MSMDPGQTLDAASLTALDPDRTPHDRAFLVVYPGPDPARTRLVELPDGVEVIFGRSRGAIVMVDDEKVSRHHARVVRRGPDIVVEDLGSRNGTQVNGTRIEGPTRVSSGDEIAVGPAVAVVGVTTGLKRRTLVGSTSYLEERLAAEVDRSVRYHRPLALLMLRLDGPFAATEASLDQIAQSVRPMDCLAEYGPEELALVLPEANRSAAEALAKRIARLVRALGQATVMIGLAVFPEDGREPDELVSRARRALRRARTGAGQEGVAAAGEEPAPGSDDLVVVDPQMRRVYDLVSRIAPTPITVLILGETGVGKELVAEELHRRSPRAPKPFVKLNCASLPETLLENELFGHERGAFTGAERRAPGYFEAAHGGTIFLDEIGEIPLGLQAKLLRVLETRRIMRLGATSELEVDVRVVAATNRDLEAEVKRGRFREDLFFRVSAFSIFVPPLRNRRSDIRPLAERFARQFALELGQPSAKLGPGALRALEIYAWPGNVRELRNAVERAVVLATGGIIEPEHLPERAREASALIAGPPIPQAMVAVGEGLDVREHIAEVERTAIVQALAACGGNQTRAAQKLGLSRRALIYKLEKYGLKPPPAGGR